MVGVSRSVVGEVVWRGFMPAVPKGLLFSAMSWECSGGSATELADPKNRASNYLSGETLQSDDMYEMAKK